MMSQSNSKNNIKLSCTIHTLSLSLYLFLTFNLNSSDKMRDVHAGVVDQKSSFSKSRRSHTSTIVNFLRTRVFNSKKNVDSFGK